MKVNAVLILVAAVLFVPSCWQLYQGVGVGMLACHERHQSPECEWNYTRTALAEAGVGSSCLLAVVGAVLTARALFRRARTGGTP